MRQPLGMTQRPVSRLVMSSTRTCPRRVRRQHSAPTCTTGAGPTVPAAAASALRFAWSFFGMDRANFLSMPVVTPQAAESSNHRATPV